MTAAVEDTPQNRARAWRNLAVLMTAQGLIGAQISMVFITAGLAGAMIAPSRCLATLPISMIVLGSMLSAPLLATVMQRHGRRIGFFVGAAGGGVGSALSAFATDPDLLAGQRRRIRHLLVDDAQHLGVRHERREQVHDAGGAARQVIALVADADEQLIQQVRYARELVRHDVRGDGQEHRSCYGAHVVVIVAES